ncbi:MAG: hypothetical protein J5637_07355 [Prevotella sp.]|nr:hypothetical protein [Prevotella sp.]
MKKILLMATMVLVALTYPGSLCAQRQVKTQKSGKVVSSSAPSAKVKQEKRVVKTTVSSQIPVMKGKPMERALARQGKVGKTTTKQTATSSRKPKMKTVKRK